VSALGCHLLVDLWGIAGDVLDDPAALRRLLEDCARTGGARIVESRFHRFEPHGVSGVLILGESHLAIHTWPEHGFAGGDVFTCGQPEICRRIADALVSRLRPTRYEIREIERGVPDGPPG